MTGSAALVVRVLTGARAGAEAALPASGRASIGHEYWHDVVIREESTRGCAVEIDMGQDGVGRLTVLDGMVSLLGSNLRAGDAALLPPYVPVMIGANAFAFGTAATDNAERWAEATAVANNAGGADSAAAPAETPVLTGLAQSWRDSGAGRLGRSLRPAAVVGVIAAVIALLLAGPAIEALQLGGGPADRTSRAIKAAGYANVTVTEATDGAIVLAGYVATDADRQRIRGLVEAKAMRATMSIETGEEIARSTADVARLNGVESRTRALGSGTIEITTAPLDYEGRKRIESLVRHDVPSLRRLVFRDDAAMDTDDAIKTISDATKRVSSVVAGDPAYVLTVDGARYFPGAMMPSGHRLVAIADRTVVLERGGHQTMLKF